MEFDVWYNSEEDVNTRQVKWIYALSYSKETRDYRRFEFDSIREIAEKIVNIKLTGWTGPYTSIRITNGAIEHYRTGVPKDNHSGADFFMLREDKDKLYEILDGRKLSEIEFSELKNEVISCLENIKE